VSALAPSRFDETTVDENFIASVRALRPPDRPNPEALGASLSPERARELFDSQMYSRQLDFVALWLRKRGAGFYTIGSCGHEGNVAVAEGMRPTDPALLHYRSGAFFVQRARQMQYPDAVFDILLGMTASRDEPIAGGRHKVFGNAKLHVPPQTSTIGSHLPKAVGMAFHLKRAARLGLTKGVPGDAIIMCSFGDASANHSTATGAINAACYIAHQGLPLPVLFVCEDNGLGISVKTAPRWIAQNFREKPGLEYFAVDGCDLLASTDVAREAVDYVRFRRRPAFLHLSVVRPLGHAGSDVALAYRTVDELRADLARDPLVATARTLVAAGESTPGEILAR
jgi:2-oxoisovalerate dehydrogenase E1 component